MSDNWTIERASAIREIAIQHESDCGIPGLFSDVRDLGGSWSAVIEHYDPDRPLERIGRPCLYTARHVWHTERSA